MASEQTQWSVYFGRSPALAGLGLRCLGAGVQSGRLVGVVDRVLDQYALVYVESGRGTLSDPTGEYSIPPGSLFWLVPGERHSYGPDDHGWRERWVLFDGPAGRTYRRLGLIRSGAVLRPSGHRQLLDGFARIRTLAGQRTVLAEAEMAVVLQEMILATAPTARSVRADDHQLVERARDLATSTATVEQIAARLDVGVARLRRAIRAEAGVGAKAYLLGVRMEIAQSMLADGDDAVAAIARRCGYDDPGYFTRAFTGYVGLSPTRFRAQQRRPTRGVSP